MNNDCSLIALGEICVNRDDPLSICDLLDDRLQRSDIVFCQLETTISERGAPSEEPINMRVHPRNIDALKAMNISTACLAGNHAMDYGRDALQDTADNLAREGISPFGAGSNLKEAIRPAVVERNGVKVAFLGYNCSLPHDSWAATQVAPGCAPLRVLTVYQPARRIHPGSPPSIQTFPDRNDMKRVLESIQAAKQVADVVAVSMHWGLFSPPHGVLDYQSDAAHQMIDAGADMILGTGPHQIKPIEVYNGKVIYYSLGNFAFDFGLKSGIDLPKMVPDFDSLSSEVNWKLEDEWLDNFAFPERGRKALVGKWQIGVGGIENAHFMPVVINNKAQPKLLTQSDKEFTEVYEYLKQLCAAARLDTKFEIDGDAIRIILHDN